MALRETALAQERFERCKTAEIWLALSVDDKSILVDWVDAGFGSKKIADALTEDGHKVAQGVLVEHFAGSCCCDDSHPVDELYGRRPRKVNA